MNHKVTVGVREACFVFQKHNSVYSDGEGGGGEGRGEGKVQDQVPRRWNVALFPPRAQRERDFEVLESGKQRSRARSIYAYVWSVAIPTERKSGQRNYVTLRKRASIASVSNVSAKRSVNERKEKKNP